MEQNICKFIQTKNISNDINILNFVYERKADFKQAYIIPAAHTLALVTAGYGVLHTACGDFELSEGCLFFTFSAKPYYIENTDGLEYLYISFIGQRVSGLFQRLNITRNAPVYHDFSFLRENWVIAFEGANEFNSDLVCEGLLLQSLSYLCVKGYEETKLSRTNTILNIKQYIDMHYIDTDLNLKSVSLKFNYNPKYVSAAFIKLVKVSFTDYVCELRMKHAETLLKGGLHNIQEVAMACGYADSLYFSKIFKKKFGVSPQNYIKREVSNSKNPL